MLSNAPCRSADHVTVELLSVLDGAREYQKDGLNKLARPRDAHAATEIHNSPACRPRSMKFAVTANKKRLRVCMECPRRRCLLPVV